MECHAGEFCWGALLGKVNIREYAIFYSFLIELYAGKIEIGAPAFGRLLKLEGPPVGLAPREVAAEGGEFPFAADLRRDKPGHAADEKRVQSRTADLGAEAGNVFVGEYPEL
ncbi:hypothetical protein [Caulobacter radicis]|uniref:hypothetical protein n=1 Tax=Caulobacter radicis TaxID=2172650 RepID=UPI00140423FE|nr:hypothetical protein [Caulobacter radicis]